MKKRHSENEETRSKAIVKLNTPLLPVLALAFVSFYIVTGYRGWLVFFIGTGGAWFLALLWVRSLERGLSINRRIHLAWAAVGDSVPELLEIKNKSKFPALWIEIIDESDQSSDPIRLVSDVEPRASRRRHPIHLFKRRGLYKLGPTRLCTGDPFGIYTLTIHDQQSNSILITPPQVPMRNLVIAHGGRAGDQRRQRYAVVREISDAGIRDYVPGDSLKRIHWPASAHTDRLIVRQLESATSDDWWIFVDLEKAVQAGAGSDSTLELSIVLAASLLTRGLSEHRRVGLALVGPKLVWLEPRSDSIHRWQFLCALSMANSGNRSLADLISLRSQTHSATQIIITPTTNPAWVANIRRENTTVLLVNPAEFGGRVSQDKVSTALAHCGIAYLHMPRKLLEEAYSTVDTRARQKPTDSKMGRRYLEQGRESWQRMG